MHEITAVETFVHISLVSGLQSTIYCIIAVALISLKR